MIYIITGKTKSVKTSKLIEMYHNDKQGDGFVFPRINKDNKLYGYECLRLSNNQVKSFKLLEQYYQLEPNYDQEFAGFKYSSNVYQEILIDIKRMIKEKVNPIYLDGIGQLELLKKGNDEAFLYALRSKIDIVISVPDTLVRKVINHYRLKDYKIISVKYKTLQIHPFYN